MMNKTLRLGFVMGGGVSLGTFSGAALSEAIKQQIVFGQYKTTDDNGQTIYKKYDRVEIDVFSGASAGAISLAIMLRVLLNYKDNYQLLGYTSVDDFNRALDSTLVKQFGQDVEDMKRYQPQKYQSLMAAQAVQVFQEHIWAKEVNIHKLLGTGIHYKDLSDTGALLDRNVIDELAKKYFQFKSFSNRGENAYLLGERVLFGCTLSNLNYTTRAVGVKYPHIQEEKVSILKALNDRMVDKVHSELRVFDLNFKKLTETEVQSMPINWVTLHMGDTVSATVQDALDYNYNKQVRNVAINDSWREIAATAIASGAFPLAFEPVVLNRYKHEYGEYWPVELRDKDTYPFTYFDGGAFNNEPIREAMQLASYIDGLNSTASFDRQIIFVDPNVQEMKQSFSVGLHNKYGVARSFFSGTVSTAQKSTLSRLFSTVPSVLKAVLNEAQTAETDELCSLVERQINRGNMRALYQGMLKESTSDDALFSLISQCKEQLFLHEYNLQLPANSLSLAREMLRITNEDQAYFSQFFPIEDLEKEVYRFLFSLHPSSVEHAHIWQYTLLCILLDSALELIGQVSNAMLVPIAPFDFYSDKPGYHLLTLPGFGMKGFLGFASDVAGKYEVDYGKYCTYRILKDLDLIAENNQRLPRPEAFNFNTFDKTLQVEVRKSLMKRIKEMMPGSLSTVVPFLEGYIKDQVEEFLATNLDGRVDRINVIFRIQVPQNLFVLHGFNNYADQARAALEPVKIGKQYYLITALSYNKLTEKWEGAYVSDQQYLQIDKEKLFDNTIKAQLELPILHKDHAALLQANPVFEYDASGDVLINYGTAMVDAKNWKLSNAISPLDETLWGEDIWYEMSSKL